MSHPLRDAARMLASASRPFASILARGFAQVQVLAGRFLLGTLVVIGALCGVIAVTFHRYVEFAHDQLIGRALAMPAPWRIVQVILTPTITFALLACHFPHAENRDCGNDRKQGSNASVRPTRAEDALDFR